MNFQSNVYIAELEAGGARLTTPRRLTLEDRNAFPAAWTSDSTSVLFWSDSNGPSQIFRQKINENTAENVVAGPDQPWMPRLSPDGKFILYATSPQGVGGSSQRIMRVGSSGEAPQSEWTCLVWATLPAQDYPRRFASWRNPAKTARKL